MDKISLPIEIKDLHRLENPTIFGNSFFGGKVFENIYIGHVLLILQQDEWKIFISLYHFEL